MHTTSFRRLTLVAAIASSFVLPVPAAEQTDIGSAFGRAVEVSGERTKKAAVTRALEEFIARRGQKRLVDLMGKLEWDKSFDYKVERSRK